MSAAERNPFSRIGSRFLLAAGFPGCGREPKVRGGAGVVCLLSIPWVRLGPCDFSTPKGSAAGGLVAGGGSLVITHIYDSGFERTIFLSKAEIPVGSPTPLRARRERGSRSAEGGLPRTPFGRKPRPTQARTTARPIVSRLALPVPLGGVGRAEGSGESPPSADTLSPGFLVRGDAAGQPDAAGLRIRSCPE